MSIGNKSTPVHVGHSVTVRMTSDMTWQELIDAAEGAGVPKTAKVRPHVVPSYSPVEPGYEEIQFTW